MSNFHLKQQQQQKQQQVASLMNKVGSTANQQQQQQVSGAQNIGKQYDRIRILGKGSFGIASVHRRRADCSLVVLKEIDLQRFRGEQEKQSAINEARIMSKLSHVNIIKYYNAYTTASKLIIEMEYASIGTLGAYLSFQVQPLEEHEILIIFRQIVSGLNYLHSMNIMHLDLKMANIFVTIEGLVKIGDFGIAQYLHSAASVAADKSAATSKLDDSTMPAPDNQNCPGNSKFNNQINKSQGSASKKLTSSHLGTLTYSSPERCLGEPTDLKSDIWSLGCILYELITSKLMFGADCLLELVLNITRVQYQPIKRANLTAGLLATFEQLISRDPRDRPSAKELLCTIDQLVLSTQAQRANQQIRQAMGKRQTGHAQGGTAFDLSTEMALIKANANQEDVSQINYPHSLVYQVRLDSRNVHMDRVNLPQTKRIKGMSKGDSHYLVLTYDNTVYGWGSKNFGQLGACGLTSSNAGINKSMSSSSRSVAINASRADLRTMSANNSANSSPSSSTQTISISSGNMNQSNKVQSNQSNQSNNNNNNQQQQQQQQQHFSKQIVMSMLEQSQPSSRPFIINELNHRKIIQVAAGRNFSVFLSKTGIVMTCGDGSTGCLGRGDLKSCFTPCMVESLLNTDVVSISCGPEHVVAVCGNGRAFAWGKNKSGRLGVGQLLNYLTDDDSSKNGTCSNRKATNSLSLGNNKLVLRPSSVQFAPDVFIKSVFCADRCTVFIDSENRCWACGENRFNKLGLDLKRRFKRNLIVDKCWIPTEITALSKYKIIMCNIGKNHSSFITSEGKLIVFGQDIDHAYRLKSNIVCARDSHRKIALELQTKRFPPNNNLNIYNKQRNKQSISKGLPLRQQQQQQQQQQNVSSTLPSPKYYKQLTQSTIYNNQLKSFKYRNLDQNKTNNQETIKRNRKKYPIYKLNKFQKVQIDSYVTKSRSIKKMPFECVIKVSCTSKFTLALTNDNRVYFWGTRSYKKDGINTLCSVPEQLIRSSIHNNNRKNGKLLKSSNEPQLVASCSDQCFIKIGATNSSLMSSIQLLGSDHPIIHAQDPRLVAKSLADLWILDYRPSHSDSSSSSSSSSSSTSSSSSCSLNSSPSRLDLHETRLKHNSSSSYGSSQSSSSCSLCCRESSCSLSNKTNDSDDLNAIALNCNEKDDYNEDDDDDDDDDDLNDCMKHAAILEPQPIVSLYVPSMFNNINNNCTLHLVDLFCFDEDRFYLILDTTIRLQHHNARQASTANGATAMSQPSPGSNQTSKALTAKSRPALANLSPGASPISKLKNQSPGNNKQVPLIKTSLAELNQIEHGEEVVATASKCSVLSSSSPEVEQVINNKLPKFETQQETIQGSDIYVSGKSHSFVRSAINQFDSATSKLDIKVPNSAIYDYEKVSNSAANHKKLDLHNCCDNNNNNTSSNNDANTDNTAISSSQGGGVSLEEPRSLSTFAGPSLGNHIVVGPTMRSLDLRQQPLQALAFGQQPRSQTSGESPSLCCGSPEAGTGSGSCASSTNSRQRRPRSRHRVRRQTNRSEQSTAAFTCNDVDETSSMPSWVRNEYHHQQKNGFQQTGVFAVDSSATEETCMSELSVTASGSSELNQCESRDSSSSSSSSSTTMASFNQQNSFNLNAASEQVSTPTFLGQQVSGPSCSNGADGCRSSSSSSESIIKSMSSRLNRCDSNPCNPLPGQVEILSPTANADKERRSNWNHVRSNHGSINDDNITLLDYRPNKLDCGQIPADSLAQRPQVIHQPVNSSLINNASLNGVPNRAGLSRSQPDISEHEYNGDARRASIIIDGAIHDGADGENLLHCAVYRSSSSQQNGVSPMHYYRSSSNFNSSISIRSNSNNLLIRPEPSSKIDFCIDQSHQRISNGTSSPQTTQVGLVDCKRQQQQQHTANEAVEAAYFWSKLHLNRSIINIAPDIDNDNNEQLVVGGVSNHHHHHHPISNNYNIQQQLHYAASRPLSQSSHQLPIKGSKRNGSSSSLASLRKSLVKLFC